MSWALLCGRADALEIREVAAVDGAHIQRPSWSPDGTRLSWEANFHETKRLHLFVADRDGTPERVQPPARARSSLTKGFESGGAEGVVHELSWSPPAIGAYVYSATDATDDYELYIGRAAIIRSPGADGGPAWSPDGAWIAFASARSGDGDLYLVEVAKVEAPPRRLTSVPRASELHVAWSPDSRSLAFVAHSTTGDNLWMAPTLESEPVQITTETGSQLHPTFSPDGKHLAYYAAKAGSERFGLFVVEARAGAEPRQILPDVRVDSHGPAWLTASSLVVVQDDDDAFDPLVRVGLTGELQRLPVDTVGNAELSVVRTADGVSLAWTAQGRRDGLKRDFRRLYATTLTP